MCGIAGIKGTDFPFGVRDLETMEGAFPWRGPDDHGVYANADHGIGLAHRRLSILDVSSAGAQPMFDRGKRQVIVFNGEIYNYLELRDELEQTGAVFTSGTDTEVILAAYRAWGPDCLDRFNGMWAFAIYDFDRRTLFLARDRLGIKPLYYYTDSRGRFYFASEVKAILAVLSDLPSMDVSCIDPYMSFGYLPGEKTFFTGIKRLLPGCCMLLDRDNRIKVDRFWDLSYTVEPDRGLVHYVEKGRALMESAIDLRLRSDVPLGIFLSGGLDSSSVVGLLAPKVDRPLKTFSVAYDLGPQYDETPFARQVAKQFATDHREFFVTAAQFRDFIPEFVRYMDEPVTESAAISLYYISRLAREHVTVALSGEGADELFGGYDFYRYMAVLDRWHGLAGPKISRGAHRLASQFLPPGHKALKYLGLGALPLEKRYKGISTYGEELKGELYRPDFKAALAGGAWDRTEAFLENLFDKTRGKAALNRMLYFDTRTWLPDDLLIKADRMSMAASIELRVPFLDYRLAEFAAALPLKYKIRGRTHKFLLKEIMKPVLPQAVIQRKKMGVSHPLKIMFKGELAGYAMDLLTDTGCRINDFFEGKTISRLLAEHRTGRQDHHRVLWQLLVLEVWIRTWGEMRRRVWKRSGVFSRILTLAVLILLSQDLCSRPARAGTVEATDARVIAGFDFKRGLLENGFDGWRYAGPGANPCGVRNGAYQGYFCKGKGDDRLTFRLHYLTYNTDHMGWLRWGYLDAETGFKVRGSALKVVLTGGAYSHEGKVRTSGEPVKSKAQFEALVSRGVDPFADRILPGDATLYLQTGSAVTPFESLRGMDRIGLWLLFPRPEKGRFEGQRTAPVYRRPGFTFCLYPFIDDSRGGHYYHGITNIPMGGWIRVEFDAHPFHYNGGDKNPYAFYRAGGYEAPGNPEAYFSRMVTFALRALEMRDRPSPAVFYLDEITAFSRPDENQETISSMAVGYDPDQRRFDISLTDKYRCRDCSGRYEVRYAFSPISQASFDRAVPCRVINFNRSLSNDEGLIYKPNNGYNQIWAGLELAEEDRDRLGEGATVHFAVKDVSNRSSLPDRDPYDDELVAVAGTGPVKRKDLIRTLAYTVHGVPWPLVFEGGGTATILNRADLQISSFPPQAESRPISFMPWICRRASFWTARAGWGAGLPKPAVFLRQFPWWTGPTQG